ncbi:MAG: hypothetical protein II240_05695, partial [Bacteroidaceae bacterium]|nr:hypothetical protein [Bacteroidaceae bacterium]
RPLGVFVCGVTYVLLSESFNAEQSLWHIANFLKACLFMAASVYNVGLYKEEKNTILSYIRQRLTHNKER